jgi:hypothetical protein
MGLLLCASTVLGGRMVRRSTMGVDLFARSVRRTVSIRPEFLPRVITRLADIGLHKLPWYVVQQSFLGRLECDGRLLNLLPVTLLLVSK